MKWTRKTPTKPGWYWYKSKKAPSFPQLPPVIAQVTKDMLERVHKSKIGQWAGPIPEPEK